MTAHPDQPDDAPASPADRRAWWQTRWFVAAIALASIIPLLWPTIPPLVDLPGHMGRYRVQLDIGRDPWFTQWYDFHWQLIGNLGIDLLVIPLSKLFGLELSVKLIVMAIPLLTVSGLLWIAREVHGRIPATALFALPLAYSYPFHFGFVNFALSMALALNAFALWLRLARLNRLRLRAAIFVPLSCLLWVCHTYGWGALGVLAFSAELVRLHDKGHGWVKSWFLAIPHCLPLCLPMAMMVIWRGGQHVSGVTGGWFDIRVKLLWAIMLLCDRWQAFDIAATALLYFVLALGFIGGDIRWSRQLGVAGILLLAAFLVLPEFVFGSAFADMRLAPFVLAIGLLALRPAPTLSRRSVGLLAGAAIAFFAVRLAGTTASFWLYGQSIDRQLQALDYVPPRARLLSFVGQTCTGHWSTPRFDHLPGIALERRRAYSNEQWSQAGAQLLGTHYAAAPRYQHDPSQYVQPDNCPPGWGQPIGHALATFPRGAFDYVWMIDPPPYDPAQVRGLVPVWRSGSSVLFRIDHAQDARPR